MIDLICQQCGGPFRRHPSQRRPYCTKPCADLARRVPDDVACARTRFARRKELGLTKPARKYTFDEDAFSRWSDDLAWLLGLIWSDGCLMKTTIFISSKDRDLLATVAGLIRHSHGPQPYNQGRHWSLVFSSKAVSRTLRDLGLTESKSLTAPWPPIPPDHQGAFARGLFDGDGSFITSNTRRGQQAPNGIVQWVGAAPLIRDGLARWLESHDLRFNLTHRRDSSLWKIRIYQQESIRRLYTMMYPMPDVPCLHRKRDKYAAWLSIGRPRSGRPRVPSVAG